MDSGDEPETLEQQGRKKRCHRHTPKQIQELEAMFKVCPHPDEKQRMQLSRELGLEARQIKFWFQNRRTQMKAQHERAGNCTLRADNDKIRCENIAMKEALKNAICPSCGGPPTNEDSYVDEQKLRMENARLKEELDRVSSFASKYLGRPVTQLPSVQPMAMSSLDLSMGGYSNPGPSSSIDLDLLSGSSSTVMPFPFPAAVSEIEKPLMVDLATRAMEELIRLIQTDEPLWVTVGRDRREVLHLETYERIFPRPGQQFKYADFHTEASRDSTVVIMNSTALVDMFIDASKWAELFPTIVSKAKNIEVLSTGIAGSKNGTLILMYGELQVLSPVIPTREFCFLRYCHQIQQGLWAIVDVSVDYPGENQLTSRSQRLPSGCLIQDMPNGYSKITWVEHMEIDKRNHTHQLYRNLVDSGMAFGAQRWLSTLQRMCERFACLMVAGISSRDLGGVIPGPDGKRSMMMLAQRMVNNFCASITASNNHGHKWTNPSGLTDVGVRLTIYRSPGPASHPSGLILSAATSIWLPVPSQRVFSFLKDEKTRAEEVARITNGSHPGNCISLLRALNSAQSNMLILQESCIDASGSLVVYTSIDLPSLNNVMSGEDPSNVPLLPSGFAILPDGQPVGGGASTSSNPMGVTSGSLVTVLFQLLVSSSPSAKLDIESVTTVTQLISTTVQQMKAALNCPSI
ncbi:homeobox-leucine zipper protein ROC8-like isoform X2 [Phoenix dactylifera]|uniref:Homeobox-leucine zipper protein ROC8-like isoform X2 n=1 Tax=Phoenix dactylifera TaxID=42345 RepID=A0A8B7BY94_PHODC|nr:homeobox-leucine zipper protein ROC8-like isoform X2 [Phoenix dactylifera]